ncbi:unnamed protein product [Clonostachys solani]|uniref:Peptidase S8/S53 domain-containing protein n=1 Tax=Clonostachys solani TaxID=160281 RepID=A0A9P0EJT7_9HYPO|nr:unnamed protein product [Clonostachys solani]
MRIFPLIFFSGLALAAAKIKRSTPADLVLHRDVTSAQLVEHKYIVILKSTADSLEISTKYDATSLYNATLNGFAAFLNDDELEAQRWESDVEYVQQVQTANISSVSTQENAGWGLSRISNSTVGSTSYSYDESAGEGTCIYILDTGISVNDPEFEGRATFVKELSGDGVSDDTVGHGTSVAACAASKTYGTSKKAKLFAVKVVGGNGEIGDSSTVIAGMDFIGQDFISRQEECPAGILVNMSVGTQPPMQSMNDAARALVEAGLFVGVAAGNFNEDASNRSPGAEPLVCTVGASDSSNNRADFSNFGELMDIYAPGKSVDTIDRFGAPISSSGTSLASPYVVGLAANLMVLEGNPGPIAMCQRLQELGVTDILGNIPTGTINILANNIAATS